MVNVEGLQVGDQRVCRGGCLEAVAGAVLNFGVGAYMGAPRGQVSCAEGRDLWCSEQHWHSPGDSSAGHFCAVPLSQRKHAACHNLLLSSRKTRCVV